MTIPSETVSPIVCAALRRETPYRTKAKWTASRPISAHIDLLVARLAECEAKRLPPYSPEPIRGRLLAIRDAPVLTSAGALARVLLAAARAYPQRAADQAGAATARWAAGELCSWWQGVVLLASPSAGLDRPARCPLPKIGEEHFDAMRVVAEGLEDAWPDLPVLLSGGQVRLLPVVDEDDGCWGDELEAPAMRPWRPA